MRERHGRGVHLRGRPPSIVLLLCFLAACNGGTPDPEPREAEPFDLRVAVTDPGSLDPALAQSRPALLVLKQICDPLVSHDQRSGELKPGLAQSWTISDDGKTVRFQLRQGVKFSNGRDLVADDFVYSLTRLADPKTRSPHHHLLDKVAGYPELRAGTSTALPGLSVPEPGVLQVQLGEPFAELPALMAHPATSPLIKEDVEGSPEFAKKPVCAGPYRVESNQTPDGALELVRFDDYYGANGAYSQGGRGYARRLIFTVVANVEDSFEQVEGGRADLAAISTGDLPRARREEGGLESGPTGHLAYIGFPVARTPFDNRDLRVRMAGAIDRRGIVQELLGESRAEAPGFLPPGSGAAAAQATCPAAEGAPEAEPPDEIVLYLNTGGGHEAWLQEVVDDWEEEFDTRTTLRTMEWGQYIDFLAGPGADGPFRLSWAAGVPTPEAILSPLFRTGSPNNFTRYSSAEFDGLIAKARATLDDAERTRVYAEAAKVLCRDQPILPVWFGMNHVAFRPGITSAVDGRLDLYGDPMLRELRAGR